jgi:hypothetical protein
LSVLPMAMSLIFIIVSLCALPISFGIVSRSFI